MGAGDLLVRVGAIVFLVGAVGTLATVAPLLLGTSRLPTPAYFVSMLMGVGLAVALAGLLRAALAQRQAAADADGGASGPAGGANGPTGDANGASAVLPGGETAGQAAAER
jgi:hypothetical protein